MVWLNCSTGAGLGHERGNTESFKTYSKNAASPVELRQYIELLRYPDVENR